MKPTIAIAFSLILTTITVTQASANVTIGNMSVSTTVPDPLNSGITVTYSLFGSNALASAQLTFFLSTTSNGSSGVTQLDSRQLLLNSNGRGLFLPPSGPQTEFISGLTMPANVRTFFQNACQPQTLFILGRVDSGTVSSTNASSMGTTKQPDFLFTAGTLSPATIQPGGTANISFSLFTQCPANAPSSVGVFLADSAFNPLSFIGSVGINPGSGTFSFPPTGITFSPTIPPGSYNIVLIADVDGVIAESNENNNAGSFALSVVPAATSTVSKIDSELDSNVPGDLSTLGDLDLNPSADYATKFKK